MDHTLSAIDKHLEEAIIYINRCSPIYAVLHRLSKQYDVLP